MKMPYKPEGEYSEKSAELGKKIVALLVDAEVSYQEANDALAQAQMLMSKDTRPTFI